MTLHDTTFHQQEASRRPIVTIRDGELLANSRDVAAYFNKEHRHVLEAIDNLLKSLAAENSATGDRAFVLRDFTDDTQPGRTFRSFDMTRDGFTLLAMGFTGSKALRWKVAFIEAFNAMEAELRKRAAAPTIDLNDPAALRGLLLTYSEKAQELQAKVDELMPAKEKLNRIEASVGSLCLTDAAKTLKVGRDQLTRFMSSRSWIYKRIGSSSWVARQDKITAGLMEHKEHLYLDSQGQERVNTSARITGKGLVKLSELLNEPVH